MTRSAEVSDEVLASRNLSLSLSRILDLQRIIIYPNYVDSKKTVAEGRRIPKDKGKPFKRHIKNSAGIRRTGRSLLIIGSH